MTPNVCIYDSEEAARGAAAALSKAGFQRQTLFLASELAGRAEATVKAAVAEGILPRGYVKFGTESLERGRSMVAVMAPFGAALDAVKIMQSNGAVDIDSQPAYIPSNAAPLSDTLGIPTLSEFSPTVGLASSNWSLSSLFGIPLLTRSQRGKAKLSDTKRPWDNSFGLPMLSRNPAPLSSLLGMKLLTRGGSKDSSFGFGLLSSNPAPLSSLFGIRTLSKDR